jgi:hypothetical protein
MNRGRRSPSRRRVRRSSAAGAAIAVLTLCLAMAASAAPGSAQSAPGRCQVTQLRISEALPEPAAGNQGVILRFKNAGSVCVLGGYPGVAGLSSTGQTIVSATRAREGMLGGFDKSGALPVVTLRHGQTASAMIEYTVGACVRSHACPRIFAFRVTPPGAVRTQRLTFSPKPDHFGPGPNYHGISVVSINPVVPGTTGADPIRRA